MVILFPFFVYLCGVQLKIIIMSKIETNKFRQGILNAIAYYFDENDNKVAQMTDAEYQDFKYDIETAGEYIEDLKKNW